MVSLFSQLSVMTHSARSAPNIAYRCYLLNFEKPLGKLRSWAWFQAFLCRLGAHQVAWLKSLLIIFIALRDDTVCLPFTAMALQHTATHCSLLITKLQPPVVLDYGNENYSACFPIECAFKVGLPLTCNMNVPLVYFLLVFCIFLTLLFKCEIKNTNSQYVCVCVCLFQMGSGILSAFSLSKVELP